MATAEVAQDSVPVLDSDLVKVVLAAAEDTTDKYSTMAPVRRSKHFTSHHFPFSQKRLQCGGVEFAIRAIDVRQASADT